MGGWVDGWMGGWVDGWMGGWVTIWLIYSAKARLWLGPFCELRDDYNQQLQQN
jgi:hypothetical protein